MNGRCGHVDKNAGASFGTLPVNEADKLGAFFWSANLLFCLPEYKAVRLYNDLVSPPKYILILVAAWGSQVFFRKFRILKCTYG